MQELERSESLAAIQLPQPLPQVIFLDAVGTLFGVKGSVGEVYCNLARQFGVEGEAAALNQAFFASFKAASPMAFPGVLAVEVAQKEYDWWETIAYQTFKQANLLDRFSDFAVFFRTLYQHFETADPWFVYPDVKSTLQQWRDRNIQLAVLSNFDSRIHSVLEALRLRDFFDSVTISTEVGAAKPSAAIFTAALKKHGITADRALHVGDSLREDYEGAKAAGLPTIWLDRPEPR